MAFLQAHIVDNAKLNGNTAAVPVMLNAMKKGARFNGGNGWRAPAILVAVLAGLVFIVLLGCRRTDAPWPGWERFQQRFIQTDGRVVDVTFNGKTTSEGQAYGLFFALVANDRPHFDAILGWTSTQLASDRLGDRLPAWLWSRGPGGKFGVRDDNSASDADLWIAYTLFEADRLWNAPAYAQVARKLLARIEQQEVAKLVSGNALLLPAPVGFALEGGRFQVNPSYMPGFIFQRFAAIDPPGPWRAIWDTYIENLDNWFPAGVAADLITVDENGRRAEPATSETGSYDAIRVYLWAGMTVPVSSDLLHALAGYVSLTRKAGRPPEKVNADSGQIIGGGDSPIGYSAAILPFLQTLNDQPLIEQQQQRLAWHEFRSRLIDRSNYYDEALGLFGQGWSEHRYHFDQEGRLRPAWETGS